MTEQFGESATPSAEPETAGSVSDQITQNIEGVLALERKEWDSISASQRRLEHVSRFVARPVYLVGLMTFVIVWMTLNSVARRLGFTPIDPPPFTWLEFVLTFVALITTTVVLIAQNRQTKLEQQRAHLDLQVNLLTEQKVTKLIHLLEELRRDLPTVVDRHDPVASVLQERTDTAHVVSALEDVGLTSDPGRVGP
jgi:uncharacterized membrane protein